MCIGFSESACSRDAISDDFGFILLWEQIRQELELVTSAILMSASPGQPERMAEILREIITLCGCKGADVHTELTNATENTHCPENSALEFRNQKSGPEIIPSVKHWADRFSARASPGNSTQVGLAIASRNKHRENERIAWVK
jgi:hypothetical protein